MVTKCGLCWNQENPDELAGEIQSEILLKTMVLCEKHKENLMSECKKCGSQSTTFKEGKSKKTGAPWKANKCDDCGEMNWVFIPKSPNGKSGNSDSLEKKVDMILAILKQNFPVKVQKVSTGEQTPF